MSYQSIHSWESGSVIDGGNRVGIVRDSGIARFGGACSDICFWQSSFLAVALTVCSRLSCCAEFCCGGDIGENTFGEHVRSERMRHTNG